MDDDTNCSYLAREELMLLESMYNPDELQVIRALDTYEATQVILKQIINGKKVEIIVHFGEKYPLYLKPSVFVRCTEWQCDGLNAELRKFINKAKLGIPLIMDVIFWVFDNAENFEKKVCKEKDSVIVTDRNDSAQNSCLARYWIYSHHIRNPVKRKKIWSSAKEHNLRGFFCSGWPGIIIVEGLRHECGSFWDEIRRLNWRRIEIRHIEESFDSLNFYRFDTFRETLFGSSDGRAINLSKLKQHLKDVGLEQGFAHLLKLMPSQ